MISFKYKLRVRYRDIDYMGIVYYSRYFEYFEAARTEMLREVGVPYNEFEETGYSLPVVKAHCEYHSGAKFDDVLVITCQIFEFPGARIRIDYSIRSEDSERIIAEGYTIHAFMKLRGRAVKPPAYFVNAFNKSWKE